MTGTASFPMVFLSHQELHPSKALDQTEVPEVVGEKDLKVDMQCSGFYGILSFDKGFMSSKLAIV